MAGQIRGWKANNVRIGPISIITLIAVICMSVLAVLAVSTAHATMSISERQADATKELYLNECAAQEFVAGIDDILAGQRASGAAGASSVAAVSSSLEAVCAQASQATGDAIEVSAEMEGAAVNAKFTGPELRQLDIVLTIQDDGTYRIDKWKAAAVQQESQSAGNLWMGA